MNRTWVKKQMERKKKCPNDGYYNQHITPNTDGEIMYEHGYRRNQYYSSRARNPRPRYEVQYNFKGVELGQHEPRIHIFF